MKNINPYICDILSKGINHDSRIFTDTILHVTQAKIVQIFALKTNFMYILIHGTKIFTAFF